MDTGVNNDWLTELLKEYEPAPMQEQATTENIEKLINFLKLKKMSSKNYNEQIKSVKQFAKANKLTFSFGANYKAKYKGIYLPSGTIKNIKNISIGCERNWGQTQSFIYIW